MENDYQYINNNNIPTKLLSEHLLEKDLTQNSLNVSDNNKIEYKGITIINKENLFSDGNIAYWKYYLGYCFVLLCEEQENLQLAMNFLYIIELFLNNYNIHNLHYIIFLFDCLLPSGQLIFMTVDFAKKLVDQSNFYS